MRVDNPSVDLAEFVTLAGKITKRKSISSTSKAVLNSLPQVTEGLLSEAFNLAKKQSLTNPWLAWASCYAVAKAAKHQGVDAALEARAAWNLGWAANECIEPRLAEQALTEAKLLFEQVEDFGWIAACNWQLNAVPWIKPNFVLAKQELELALIELQKNGMTNFIPYCELSLAFANILIARPDTFEAAEELLEAAEGVFHSIGDPLGMIVSRLHRTNMLRRKSEREEAVRVLVEVKKACAEYGAAVELAKANYQLAMNHSVMGKQIDLAHSFFSQALSTFRSADLSVWEAMCRYGLGMLRTRQGHYRKANQDLAAARKVFERYQIPSMVADALNDAARVALIGGEYPLALDHFKRAVEINQKMGATLSGTIARTNLGHTYAKLGNYQSALVHLEKALREAEKLENPGRLADCQLYLAEVWMQLGRYPDALALLNAIEQNAPSELKALAFEASLSKAYCLIRSHQTKEASAFILKELDRWRDSQAKPDIPLLNRALAQLLFEEDRVKAEGLLRQALTDFKALHMAEEEASCLMLLGEIYASSNRPEKASAAWQKSLSKVKAGVPEIRISCLIGLAEIYEEKGENIRALSLYRQVAQTLNDLRSDYWQPSIFSWHMVGLAPGLEKAFLFFRSNGYMKDTVVLMEGIKAHTFKQDLSRGKMFGSANLRIKHIRASIEKTQETIDSQTKGDWLTKLAKSQPSYSKLIPLIEDLEQQYGCLQRAAGEKRAPLTSKFEIRRFREAATEHLDHDWAALDYYLTSQEITIVLITPKQTIFQAVKLTPRLNIALAAFGHGNLTDQVIKGDLLVLAEQLLPAELRKNLSERRVLLVSPHQSLWSVPWAGLPLIPQSVQIIDAFSPVTVPSLESLLMLWERSKPRGKKGAIYGGFIGLSDFGGHQNDLPLVQEEFKYLKSAPDIELSHLLNEQATLENVMQFLSGTSFGVSRKKDFLHLATHIQYDPRSNYLCRIQLADTSAWSEEFFPANNLPELVYVSACNGASNFAYESGEQIGLPLTCLARGAQAVVGSKTIIDDKVALELTKSFYTYLVREGQTVGDALARAQQHLRDEGARFSDWANILCLGIPDLKF